MKKPLIALDLDGTLLDKQGRYSIKTRDYLRLLGKRGFQIVLASGRPLRAMLPIYQDLQCTGPVICYNGTYVLNPNDPSFPARKDAFRKDAIRAIYKEAKPLIQACMCESESSVYVDELDSNLNRYFPFDGMKIITSPIDVSLNEDVYTCLFRSESKNNVALEDIARKHPNIGWRSWNDSCYSELFILGEDKGDALRYLMCSLGYQKEDVYAFGDAVNDITMLDEAGHPFAMKGNKVPEHLDRFPQSKNPVGEDGVYETLMDCFGL